jgi:hypothetical protein
MLGEEQIGVPLNTSVVLIDTSYFLPSEIRCQKPPLQCNGGKNHKLQAVYLRLIHDFGG